MFFFPRPVQFLAKASRFSSQLCGAIDFNIIDFLCHYQPLAPLFLVLCSQKCFLYQNGSSKKKTKKKKAEKKRKQQRKKALNTAKKRSEASTTSDQNDMARQQHNIVMLMYYIKQHKNILFWGTKKKVIISWKLCRHWNFEGERRGSRAFNGPGETEQKSFSFWRGSFEQTAAAQTDGANLKRSQILWPSLVSMSNFMHRDRWGLCPSSAKKKWDLHNFHLFALAVAAVRQ